jgi:hypothetical protein
VGIEVFALQYARLGWPRGAKEKRDLMRLPHQASAEGETPDMALTAPIIPQTGPIRAPFCGQGRAIALKLTSGAGYL